MDSKIREVKQVGMDVHKQFSRVTARDANGKILFRQRLEHADRDVLRREFATWPCGTPVVIEGTFGWGWMSDDLLASGLQARLTSGAKIHGWRIARKRAKNNRLDADLLSELPSEKTNWWEVWLAPPQVRQEREWLRYRRGLVQTQTCYKNRIQAVLHRHGIINTKSDLFGKQGQKLLAALIGKEDPRLPASAKEELKGSLKVLSLQRNLIAGVTRQWRTFMTSRPEQATQLWKSLPGVGWILACTIQAEVGTIERFKNSGCLARYSLLAPCDDDSGEEDSTKAPTGRHVGRVGRQTLKWAFMQAALSAVKKSPQLLDLFNRITDNGRHRRIIGYMAVAHRLSVMGFSCVKNKRQYSETPPTKTGRKAVGRTSQNAHSEAGVPVPAVAAASP